MNNYDIELFRRVAQEGSITRASRAEVMDYNSLIRKIDALEMEMGTRLLIRTTHGIRLTPAGRILLRGSDRLLEEYDRVVEEVRRAEKEMRPRLVVAVTPRIRGQQLAALWEVLRKEYPEHVLLLRAYGDTRDEQARMYEEMGLKYDYLACFNIRKKADTRYCFLPAFSEELAAGLPRTSPLYARKRIRPADLAGRALLMPNTIVYPGLARYEQWMKKHIPQLEIRYDREAGDNLLNRALCEEIPVMIPKSWGDMHPDVKAVPMEGFYGGPMTIPFGCLYDKPEASAQKKTA